MSYVFFPIFPPATFLSLSQIKMYSAKQFCFYVKKTFNKFFFFHVGYHNGQDCGLKVAGFCSRPKVQGAESVVCDGKTGHCALLGLCPGTKEVQTVLLKCGAQSSAPVPQVVRESDCHCSRLGGLGRVGMKRDIFEWCGQR